MKKMIAVLVALSMLLCCLPGLAEGAPTVFEQTGVSVDLQSVLDVTTNYLDVGESGIFSHNPTVGFVYLDYYALSREAVDALGDRYQAVDEAGQEKIMAIMGEAFANLALVIVTDDPVPDAAIELVMGERPEGTEVMELGAAERYRFFAVLPPLQAPAVSYDAIDEFGIDPEAELRGEEALLADMERVRAAFVERLQAVELSAPYDPDAAYIGRTLAFETTDVDGNPVTSEELFRDNVVTMVNLWGMWCINCVNEMEELAEIHTRLREKGCGVVGVELEYMPIDTIVEDIHAFMEEKGMNYPSVLMPEGNEILGGVTGYPTTFFVDSEGTILTYPIDGAQVDRYEPTLDKLLAGEAADASAAKNGAGAYRVIVSDPDGNPVEGAVIQFCDDVTCAFQPTDAEGVATFSAEAEKVYEVHVLTAPEGYAPDETVYNTLDTFSDVSIVLERAE